jgi:hypothetical protein
MDELIKTLEKELTKVNGHDLNDISREWLKTMSSCYKDLIIARLLEEVRTGKKVIKRSTVSGEIYIKDSGL